MKPKINIPKSFFSFLIVSSLFWLLINLSKEYVTTISYNVSYDKLAQHKIFQENPIEEIKVKVKGTGFKLLSANFAKRNISLLTDKLKTRADGVNFILPKEQESSIQNQLYSGLQFQNILQDTILLHLGTLASKKVAVVINTEINFQLGYDLASSIKVMPDSILISGPKAQLANIHSVQTKNIVLEEVSKTQKLIVDIERPSDNEKVNISDAKVEVLITVDKFTEGEFMVPFEIKNLPKGITINTYPKKVKIVFKVGLIDFNKITADSFKVVCDYNASQENGLNYLIPKIKTKSILVRSARLSQSKIDFLIQK